MTTKQAWDLLYALQDAIENAEDDSINMDCITPDLISAREFSAFSLGLIDACLTTTTRIVSEGYAPGDTYDASFERSIITRANKLAQKAAGVATLLETLSMASNMFNDLLKGDKQ